MDIFDNLRLASYAAAAEAFDQSKNIFCGFLPMIEHLLLISADKESVPFLALQQTIDTTYNVCIPKDTLRYLIQLLSAQGKVEFLNNRKIVINYQELSKSIATKEEINAEIEALFNAFQDYLVCKGFSVSVEEIRTQICNWIYCHSSELASFIQIDSVSYNEQHIANSEDWMYGPDLLDFLLESKQKRTPFFASFVRLYDGAVQTSLLNFTPNQIKEVANEKFTLQNAILDTNFILRLMGLQAQFDNEAADATWKTLHKSGTNFFVLSQTIQEASTTIKNFISEIAPYTQHVREFLPKSKVKTSGFWNAYQNGVSRTQFFELSKEENIRSLLTTKYAVTIIDDFDDQNLDQYEVQDLIISKNIDRYSIRQATHDLLLISCCKKRRPKRIKNLVETSWWVLTNDSKLTFWNRKSSAPFQECITEVQLSNLLWLQAKKSSAEGLTNAIIALSSKHTIGTAEVSVFANRIDHYRKQNANDPQKLDALALVFASNTLTSEDITNANTDEDQFADFISSRVAEIRDQQAKQEEEMSSVKTQNEEISKKLIHSEEEKTDLSAKLLSSSQNNSALVAENKELKTKLTATENQAKKSIILRDLKDLEKEISEMTRSEHELERIIAYKNSRQVSSSRFVLACILIPSIIVTLLAIHFGKPV